MKETFHTILILLTLSTFVIAQNKLECSISMDSIMMIGQPMYLEYEISIKDDEIKSIYYDPRGSNFNDLKRDESFKVKLFNVDGDTIPLKKSTLDKIMAYSKRVGFITPRKDESLTYKHWIEDWFELESLGTYTIELTKNFASRNINDILYNETKTCRALFSVTTSDSTELSNSIQNLWIKANDTNLFEDKRKYLDIIAKSKSKITIPYLEQLLVDGKSTFDIQIAIRGLSKFIDDKQAFNIIAKVFDIEDSRFWSSSASKELNNSVLDNVHHSAIHALSKFSDSLTIPLMIEQQGNRYYAVRLYIMQQLPRKNLELGKQVIKNNINDSHETVRSEAIRLLKHYEKE